MAASPVKKEAGGASRCRPRETFSEIFPKPGPVEAHPVNGHERPQADSPSGTRRRLPRIPSPRGSRKVTVVLLLGCRIGRGLGRTDALALDLILPLPEFLESRLLMREIGQSVRKRSQTENQENGIARQVALDHSL